MTFSEAKKIALKKAKRDGQEYIVLPSEKGDFYVINRDLTDDYDLSEAVFSTLD